MMETAIETRISDDRLIEDLPRLRLEFKELSSILFGEDYSSYAIQVIPEEYHPWNVLKRSREMYIQETVNLFQEANGLYKLFMTPTINEWDN